jgi:MYXO-CTERM domain-containing protein
MRCYRSQASGFGAAINGPAWSDAAGWGFVGYWSTIRLVDVNADGKADLCARSSSGLECHLSTGSGFGAAVNGPGWSDDSGWSRHKHYSTLRFADLDGDGDLDVCARAGKGIVCAPWEGSGFGAVFDGPALSDAAGWSALRFYQTIRMLDLNADGKADLCGRASAGMRCYLSQGTSFGAEIVGPAWADATNWDEPRHFSTIRGAGPLGGPGGAGGTGGTGGASGNGGTTSDGGGVAGLAGGGSTAGSSAGGTSGGSGAAGGSSGGSSGTSGSGSAQSHESAEEDSGCSCRAGSRSSPLAAFGALGALVLALRRRRRA